ncbi:MAG TPA: ATP-binding cassette domain-containing protein, partial [Clostridia bacterium]|nr:ATP-binding cassette domain-containing protein [Clostridia bacterium]
MPPILEVTGISKRFQATQALCDVDFSVEPGEVHALMGENGAGKSTLAKIIAGVVTPDSGEIRMQGEIVRIDSPSRAQELGIGMVFQELDLFAHLTVAENMAIGNRGIDEGFFTEPRKLSAWCAPFLDRVKLSVDP